MPPTLLDRSQSCQHFLKKIFQIRPDTPELEHFSRQRFPVKNPGLVRKGPTWPFLGRAYAPLSLARRVEY